MSDFRQAKVLLLSGRVFLINYLKKKKSKAHAHAQDRLGYVHPRKHHWVALPRAEKIHLECSSLPQ